MGFEPTGPRRGLQISNLLLSTGSANLPVWRGLPVLPMVGFPGDQSAERSSTLHPLFGGLCGLFTHVSQVGSQVFSMDRIRISTNYRSIIWRGYRGSNPDHPRDRRVFYPFETIAPKCGGHRLGLAVSAIVVRSNPASSKGRAVHDEVCLSHPATPYDLLGSGGWNTIRPSQRPSSPGFREPGLYRSGGEVGI